MSAKYLIVETPSERPRVPRCDLGPHASRRAAITSAKRQGLVAFTVISIRRRAA